MRSLFRAALIALLIVSFAAPLWAASSVAGLNCNGNFYVKTSGGVTKASILQTNGNTAIAGDLAINTNKFVVTGSTGALAWIPSTITTTDVMTLTMAGLTTGTGLE